MLVKPTPEQIEAFLADLLALYERHNLRLCSRENIGICGDANKRTAVRDRAKFKDPVEGDYDEYEPELYIDVTEAATAVDDIRRHMDLPHRYAQY